VFLAASVAAFSSGQWSAEAEDSDDIFASDPEPAAKPELKKKSNAMQAVLRAVAKGACDMYAPDESFADPFGADAPPPIAKPAAAQDPFLQPEEQAGPRPRRAEGNACDREPEGPPCFWREPAGRVEAPPPRSPKTRIEDALKHPTELELFETPLECVVNLIKENHRIEVQIDRKAFDDAGIATDVLITKGLKGISLRSGLNLMLHELDLTWLVRDEVLVITTSEVAKKSCYLETYDVSDLIDLGDEKGGPAAAGKRLAETLAATMPRSTAEDAPKPGPIACNTFGNVSILTTTQTREGHEHIAQWLADVRGKLAEKKPAAQPKKKRGKPTAEAAILKALKNKVSVDYVEKSLDEAVADLQERCKINIQIDKKALNDVGIATDTLITKRLEGISLRSALRLMLHELELTYMIKDQALLITTPEVAEQHLTTIIYDVADLVVYRNKEGELWDDYQGLTDAITSSIRSCTWDAAGGPGSIAGQSFRGSKVLIVSHSQDVHEEIVDFLTQLRSVTQKTPNAPPPRREPPVSQMQFLVDPRGDSPLPRTPAQSTPEPKPPADKAGGMGGIGGGMF
jgi:hypothetical protein